MPLCERIRINAGRPFIHSLVARLLVVVMMVTVITAFNVYKKESQIMGQSSQNNQNVIYSSISWENNDKETKKPNHDKDIF